MSLVLSLNLPSFVVLVFYFQCLLFFCLPSSLLCVFNFQFFVSILPYVFNVLSLYLPSIVSSIFYPYLGRKIGNGMSYKKCCQGY
jgi:hypothetical protein